MRLILVDLPDGKRFHFDPVALSRPIFDLRCGMTSLADKLIARTRPRDVACFVPDYMAAAYAEQSPWPVNDPASLAGDDLLLIHGRVRADRFDVDTVGPGEAFFDADGQCLYARIPRAELARLSATSIDALLRSVRQTLPHGSGPAPATWDYAWELVLENPRSLAADFAAAGRGGVEGAVEQPFSLRGSERDLYIARDSVVHPMVVVDTSQGPVFIDEGAEIHSFTRIEGPCYIGRKSVLYRANCRAGNSIGPMCRMGGEIEASIVHGYSNKYHDGFLGHAYVGEWVNLGAMTTNSDLKNDYSAVSVVLDGRHAIDTGSPKVGSLMGDHVRTSIGTLLNTGAYVGAMALLVATGGLLPKFIPSFAWFVRGVATEGLGEGRLYATAKMAMARRGREWTEAQQTMWREIYQLTAPARRDTIRRGQRAAVAKGMGM